LVIVVKVATFGVWRRDKIPEFGEALNGGSGIGTKCLLFLQANPFDELLI
jgi:hypothetical protein